MNKKGFTVVELLVSFALTTLVVALLFQMLLSLKEMYISSGVKTQLLNKQAIINSKISSDFENKVVKIALKCGSNCLNFIFEDGTNKELIIDSGTYTLTYGDYVTRLVDGSEFRDIDIHTETTVGVSSGVEDSFITIKIPIYHKLLEENFGVNLVYQYDSRTTSITDITFNSDTDVEETIFLKGESVTYSPNNVTYVDPGYYTILSDGTVVDADTDVTVTGTVGSTVGTTYTLTYTLRDSLSNILDVKTRSVTIVTAVYNYDYTGSVQTFTAPLTGSFQFEAWGAQGAGTVGGNGAYTKGKMFLNKDDVIYVFVGQRNTTAGATSFNGGTGTSGGFPGGGASDFRTTTGAWNDTTSLRSRIMTAGGGGSGNVSNKSQGGSLFGLPGNTTATGGTQNTGGTGSDSFSAGSFGIGGNGCGGGGGYYGGGGASCANSAGGGSSFISGYPGANAVNSSGVHTNQNIHFSNLSFYDTLMTSGNASMPNPRGAGNITGNTGNGYARITVISIESV